MAKRGKRAIRKIDLGGNRGYCWPDPGIVKTAKCGVCGSKMNVKRNVLSATSWAESMGGRKHLHDSFQCPNIEKSWHERIVDLKGEALDTSSERLAKIFEEEIIEILEANVK